MPMFGGREATFFDEDTGVELNRVPIKRSKIEAGAQTDTVFKYARLGLPQHRIAAMLGVHPLEISEILGDKPRAPGTSDLHDGHGDPNQPDLEL
ncbi:hypothetical protein [Pseudogemmobacter humi]|uniref:Uncharacterized protein n=1 Tax=Pseudogemmobacter humi TaxID=2483812 RepID=A0A3P5WYE6_9RHOB|nr:hypothetical protein [Pseudogemmobacter humi]VDC28243.1 hypothetical protein XINFAN_02019 [Pseudogemmobacter humi]